LKKNNYLIVGGAGFIGSNLVEKLSQNKNNKCYIIDSFNKNSGALRHNIPNRNNIVILKSEISKIKNIKHLIEKSKYIFCLQGLNGHSYSMHFPIEDAKENILSNLYILEACRKYNPNIKIFYTSTRQVYGRTRSKKLINENNKVNPVDINGISKFSSEMYYTFYKKHYSLKIVILRITNVFGKNMRVKDSKLNFIGYWIKESIVNNTIQVFGKGDQTRDYLYIDDLIKIFIKLMKKKFDDNYIFNIGGNEKLSLIQLSLILSKINKNLKIKKINNTSTSKIDIGSLSLNSNKLINKIGLIHYTPIYKGLRNTYKFYKNNLKKYL
jgi:UDP-glucose 4-epimerase